MDHLETCPVCHQTNLKTYLSCRDYTVSNEIFQLDKCVTCGFVMTNPRPEIRELGRYYQSDAYISHSDQSKGIVDYVYKLSRLFTLRWKFKLITRHSLQPPKSVLDFGCGTGSFLHTCQEHHLSISGVEPTAAARAQASAKTKTTIASALSEIPNQFDVITLWHVLEHVADLHPTMQDLKNRLRENGTMFIAVPNLESQDARNYNEYWAGFDVPRHLWHFSKKTMEKLLKQHQLKISTILPMRLDAYYVSLLSEKYKNGDTSVSNMLRALTAGWKSNSAANHTKEYSSLIYIVRK